MSKAREMFEISIRDAEDLLAHFDSQTKPPPKNAEVLKRAGLVMALTAWETFVEDLVYQQVSRNPQVLEQDGIRLAAAPVPSIPGLRAWTDDFNNLFQVLK